ncbi:MAG: hypothetical protein SXV54_09655 [Chloroflexota bacterium]|nr:hypothetical protein [Chloroflexota bacterium]
MKKPRWLFILLLALLLGLGWQGLDWPLAPIPTSPTETPVPVVRASETPTIAPSPTSPATPTPRPTGTPTPTPTTTQTPQPTTTSTPSPTHTPTPTAPLVSVAVATPVPASVGMIHPYVAPAVLANYFPWYDPETWATGCTSGGDLPLDGVYQSDDPGVIARHVGQAQAAGLDGFAVHWFAPSDRTDTNFGQVLAQSPDGFNSTVTFLYHILPGVNQQGVIDALHHVINSYSGHPRFFRVGGKPVILFGDMYRVPDGSGARPASDQDVATALARWTEIRQAVDPDRNIWWIAEGLKPDYLAVFDGLYVYKIDHACCPNSYLSASRWAGWTRDWEQETGQPKLWVGTVMPGWDDLNSGQAHCVDLRVSSAPFARDRADGAYYARTWEAILPTRPDFVVLHSFNEWVEGSYVEPSIRFGDLYVQLTAQWIARFKDGR